MLRIKTHGSPLYLLMIILLTVISLALKIAMAGHINTEHTANMVLPFENYMTAHNLQISDRFNLNREGSFIAYIYRHKSCDGGVIVTPMYRNSEGVDLFNRQTLYKHYAMGEVFFMLEDQRYHRFPERRFWIAQKTHALKHMMNIAQRDKPYILAVRVFGACAHQLPRAMHY